MPPCWLALAAVAAAALAKAAAAAGEGCALGGREEEEVDSVGLLQGRLARRPHLKAEPSEEQPRFDHAATNFASSPIRGFIWNPHWQCFVHSPSDCSPNAQQALTKVLGSDLDFANIVELEPQPPYQPPPSWQMLQSECGIDVTTLFYYSEKWSPLGTSHRGCMEGNDRPFVVQGFTSRITGMKVVVVGAHFPHSYDWSSLSAAIADVTSSAGTNNVFFMADTNTDISSTDVFSRLEVASSAASFSTSLLPTCCNTTTPGFVFNYDRVIANFGTSMATEELFDPVPAWANDEFHKGLIGTLSM